MLTTAKERISLLKNGFEEKKIEALYIHYNNFRIIQNPILFDLNRPFKGLAKN